MNLRLQICSLFLMVSTWVWSNDSKPTLAVYLPDYRVKTGDETPLLYGSTHLILFSAKPNDDGSVDFSRITPELLSFAQKARIEQTIKVTACVGGWGRGKQFANAVSTPTNRERFANALLDFCKQNDLDGIDLDWEFPKGEEEHANFTVFIQLLSKKLHKQKRILTAAIGYTRPLSKECWQYLDQVNLMSYQPWNVEPYEPWLTESVKRFLDSGLPAEKLIIGVGFFTKEKLGERRSVSWKNTVDGKLPESDHGYWPIGREACDVRLKLMKQFNLGGIMIWDYGHDSQDPEQSLLNYLSGQIKLSPTQ